MVTFNYDLTGIKKINMNNYEKFKYLHLQKTPLLLSNVWNAGSAKVSEKCGLKLLLHPVQL